MLHISILINDQGTKTNNRTSPQIEAGKFQRRLTQNIGK